MCRLLWPDVHFPPAPVAWVGCELPETGHPTPRLEADMTVCDPLWIADSDPHWHSYIAVDVTLTMPGRNQMNQDYADIRDLTKKPRSSSMRRGRGTVITIRNVQNISTPGLQ